MNRGQPDQSRYIQELQGQIIQLQGQMRDYAERDTQTKFFMAKLKRYVKQLEAESGVQSAELGDG